LPGGFNLRVFGKGPNWGWFEERAGVVIMWTFPPLGTWAFPGADFGTRSCVPSRGPPLTGSEGGRGKSRREGEANKFLAFSENL